MAGEWNCVGILWKLLHVCHLGTGSRNHLGLFGQSVLDKALCVFWASSQHGDPNATMLDYWNMAHMSAASSKSRSFIAFLMT
jgi:hypothetical protein